MSAKGPTKRTLLMVEAYKAGGTLVEVGRQFGVASQCVYIHVKRYAPESIRPHGETRPRSVGPPGHELFRQGTCRDCEVSLWAYRPTPRDLCGHCKAEAKAAA